MPTLLIYRSHYRAVFHGIMGQIQQHPIFYLRKSGCSISLSRHTACTSVLPVTIQRKIHIIQSSKGSAVAAGIITDKVVKRPLYYRLLFWASSIRKLLFCVLLPETMLFAVINMPLTSGQHLLAALTLHPVRYGHRRLH